MSKREYLGRYSLIIKKLRRFPASFAEISDYLKLESELQEFNFNVSLRTFQRDLDEIRSLYNIDIQYDRSRKAYFIDYEEQSEVNERILEAFDTFNALNVADRLSGYVHLEKRRPQGTENLYGLLHAIKNRLRVRFTYHKFWEDTPSQREGEPYALKEFKNRWYLMLKDIRDGRVKSYGLDRLSDLEITKEKFQYPTDYHIEQQYCYCFGIISPDNEKPQDIVLSFDPFQGKYIKTLPLHDTQEILVDNEKELRVKLKLCVTFDLLMELLSYGGNMKVIGPESLIEQIKQSHEKAFQQYH